MIPPLSAFSISCTINALLAISLGIFVLIAPASNRKLTSLWGIASLFIALWSLGLGMMTSEPMHDIAMKWMQLHYLGCIFIPPSYFHFVSVLTRTNFWHRKTVLFAYAVSLALLILNLNGLLVQTVEPTGEFKNYTVFGRFYLLFVIHLIGFVVALHYLLLKELPHASGMRRQQIKLVLLASFVGFVGGLSTLFPVFNITKFYHLNYCMGLYVIIMTYAVLRHKLMDIEVIIKKTLVFTGLFGMVLGVVGLVTTVMQYVGDKYLAVPQMASTAVSVCFVVLFYDPTRKLLVHLTDKFLFQKAYDYQKILKDASRGMSRIESLSHLLGLVIHFITMKMRIKSAAVLQWNRAAGEFAIGHQRGFTKKFLHYELKPDHPLITYFSREKEAITIEQVKDYIQAGGKKRVKGERPHQYDFEAIRKAMEELQAACCVPSFLTKELRNILVLGYKKSDYPFTNEDITVLFTLAQESAIAIENARLFDEAIKKNEELRSINEQLGYSKALLLKALKETEVANKQLQDTQAQLIHEQKMATLGRLAASVGHEVNNPLTILSMNVSRAILKYRKNPELKVAEVLELFQKMEQNIGRIKAVVNTLTGLLKKSEKGKFEPLSLKLILEETLPLVQFQTYLDNLTGTEVEFDIPGNVPLIRGDLERLQEVFLNLFINAYHAMIGRRNRRIRVTAEIEPGNPRMVGIHFTDNGSGMNEEVMKKIFNYGYTTKPPGKGSGMGLYMCKYIIELHGGEIKVKSTLGVGTTFTLTLPIHEETGTETGGLPPMRATS